MRSVPAVVATVAPVRRLRRWRTTASAGVREYVPIRLKPSGAGIGECGSRGTALLRTDLTASWKAKGTSAACAMCRLRTARGSTSTMTMLVARINRRRAGNAFAGCYACIAIPHWVTLRACTSWPRSTCRIRQGVGQAGGETRKLWRSRRFGNPGDSSPGFPNLVDRTGLEPVAFSMSTRRASRLRQRSPSLIATGRRLPEDERASCLERVRSQGHQKHEDLVAVAVGEARGRLSTAGSSPPRCLRAAGRGLGDNEFV